MLRRTALFASFAALAGAALLASSCGGSNPPPTRPDAGTAEPQVGRSCNVDAECGGLRCDPVRRQCICSSDDDCVRLNPGTDLKFCDNFTGMCVGSITGCTSDMACPAASYCDEKGRTCKPRKGLCEECATDRECGGDADNCIADAALGKSFCGKACTSEEDCPSDTACTAFGDVKQCWPDSGNNCRVFKGCTPDSKASCNSTADCKDPDQVCDPGSGLCIARVHDCVFGQICSPETTPDGKHLCVDQCSSDADCIAIDPRMRCVSRACEVIGECAATAADPSGDKSCPANKVCSFKPGLTAGTCVAFCRSDQECSAGMVCANTPDNRRKCQPGCRVNADCPLDRVCVLSGATGTCQGTTGATCQSDIVCPLCAVCDLRTNGCVVKSEANDGFCRLCGTDTDCGDGHCVDLNGSMRCGQPCSPCPAGTSCPFTGCPQGFVCTQLCVGGVQNGFECVGGEVFAECFPVDQNCLDANGQEKCLP